jgi:hypothetical protein
MSTPPEHPPVTVTLTLDHPALGYQLACLCARLTPAICKEHLIDPVSNEGRSEDLMTTTMAAVFALGDALHAAGVRRR